jgi:hypothetical protein
VRRGKPLQLSGTLERYLIVTSVAEPIGNAKEIEPVPVLGLGNSTHDAVWRHDGDLMRTIEALRKAVAPEEAA